MVTRKKILKKANAELTEIVPWLPWLVFLIIGVVIIGFIIWGVINL